MRIREQCKYIIECDGCGRGLGLSKTSFDTEKEAWEDVEAAAQLHDQGVLCRPCQIKEDERLAASETPSIDLHREIKRLKDLLQRARETHDKELKDLQRQRTSHRKHFEEKIDFMERELQEALKELYDTQAKLATCEHQITTLRDQRDNALLESDKKERELHELNARLSAYRAEKDTPEMTSEEIKAWWETTLKVIPLR